MVLGLALAGLMADTMPQLAVASTVPFLLAEKVQIPSHTAQRSPTAQRTVTGAGAAVAAANGPAGPILTLFSSVA